MILHVVVHTPTRKRILVAYDEQDAVWFKNNCPHYKPEELTIEAQGQTF